MSDFIHSHCATCINLKKCHAYVEFTKNRKVLRSTSDRVPNGPARQRSSNDDSRTRVDSGSNLESLNEFVKCEIISCPKRCDFAFHSCKLREHLLLCPKQIVECINAGYGCDMVMERRFTGKHLEYCPASVVVCSMEWSRRCAESVPFEKNSSDLDVAALNEDLETVKAFRRNVPAALRRLLQTRIHEIALMPLGVAGHRIPDCISCEVEVQGKAQENGCDLGDPLPVQERVDRVSPPAGLQGSLVEQLKQLPATTSLHWKEKLNEPEERLLSLNFEVTSKHSGRSMACSTFMCSQELRRDEFADHFRNVHSEIRTQLDGWLFRRCPMASYGCPYGSLKFFPVMETNRPTNSYEITYNSTLKSFCPTLKPEFVVGYGSNNPVCDETKQIALCDLPNELLLRLTTYLDPSSLKCLTLTSARMRDICGEVVSKRGIVVLDWEKETKEFGKFWRYRGKRWIFSSAFSPIRNWSMSKSPSIGSHLLTCPFYSKHHINQPKFAYASPQDLNPHL